MTRMESPADRNVLALMKGEEKYVFIFTDEQRLNVIRTVGRFAANPDLSFDWRDAAVLMERIALREDS